MHPELTNHILWLFGACLIATLAFAGLLIRSGPPRTAGLGFLAISAISLAALFWRSGLLMLPILALTSLLLGVSLLKNTRPYRWGLLAFSVGTLASYSWMWNLLLGLYRT